MVYNKSAVCSSFCTKLLIFSFTCVPNFGKKQIKNKNKKINKDCYQAVPAKQTAILHTGNKKRHPAYIPEHMPEMPDSHSYIRTPTHRQPVTDYESVREKGKNSFTILDLYLLY